MLRSPALLAAVATRVEPHHITAAGGTKFQSILFSVVQNHYGQFQKAPDEATVRVEVNSIIEQFVGTGSGLAFQFETEMTDFFAFRTVVDANSEELARTILQRISEQLVMLPAAQEVMQTALSMSDTNLSQLAEKLQDLEAQQAMLVGEQAQAGVIDRPMPEDGDRLPTGIPWIDARLAGGIMLGAGLAVLAPQGGGKTSLGISLCINQALLGKDALLVLFEQGLDKAVKRKITAATVGFPYPLLEKHKDDLSAAIKEAGIDPQIAAKRIDAVNKHLFILDMVPRTGALRAIVAEIDQMTSRGHKPTYVYVDWAGKIADRLMAGADDSKIDKRFDALKLIGSTLTDIAAKNNLVMICSQQMASQAALGGPLRVNDQYCAADCRSFTETFRYVFVINQRDPATKMSLFRVPKSRESDRLDEGFAVQFRGDYCDFIDMSHAYKADKRRFKPVHAKTPTLPKEH